MPTYQKNAVQGYLTSGVALPSQKVGWNPNNRGYPDVGGIGENVCNLDPGSPCSLVAGTSASTPLWASLITLLNQDRLNAHKTPLGFVNPIIYKMYDTNPDLYFNNNFTATNNGGECGTALGFNSVHGWNPLVGCGSPNFAEIRKFIATLP